MLLGILICCGVETPREVVQGLFRGSSEFPDLDLLYPPAPSPPSKPLLYHNTYIISLYLPSIMKRSLETANIGQNGLDRQNPFRRQSPISCQFCRSKKLKCDRGHPCSNCVARRVVCVSALSTERPGGGGSSEPVAGVRRSVSGC